MQWQQHTCNTKCLFQDIEPPKKKTFKKWTRKKKLLTKKIIQTRLHVFSIISNSTPIKHSLINMFFLIQYFSCCIYDVSNPIITTNHVLIKPHFVLPVNVGSIYCQKNTIVTSNCCSQEKVSKLKPVSLPQCKNTGI